MKKRRRTLGIIGLVLAVLGGLGYGALPMFLGFYVIPWALALVFLAIWAAGNMDVIRSFGRGRTARLGAGSAVSVLVVLAILVIAAAVTQKHHVRYDFTAGKRHSLADQTLKILKSLTREVNVTGFFQDTGSPQVEFAHELLARYADASSHFHYDVVDIDRNPTRTRVAGVSKPNTILVESGEKSETVSQLTEDKLTSAVIRVTRPGRKMIYFLTGHSEKDPDSIEKSGYSDVRGLLEEQGYDVKTLMLSQVEGIPPDASVLVAAGPKKDLLPVETQAIETYLHGGGRVLLMIDPESAEGMIDFMDKLNVVLGRDLVVDPMRHAFGGDYLMPMAVKYEDFLSAAGFKLMTFFPEARSVRPASQAEGATVKSLVLTGTEAWAETDLDRLKTGSAQFNPGEDIQGPIALAVEGTIKPSPDRSGEKDGAKTDHVGQFVVFGDSDFASNGYIHLQGNGDLFQMVMNHLAEESDIVAIRPPREAFRPLTLSAIQARLVFWLPVIVLPLAVLGVGILVLVRRRKMA